MKALGLLFEEQYTVVYLRELCELHTTVLLIEGKAQLGCARTSYARPIPGLGIPLATGMEALWPTDAQGNQTSAGAGSFHKEKNSHSCLAVGALPGEAPGSMPEVPKL